jgi:RND family efflux transporter MFP subunit
MNSSRLLTILLSTLVVAVGASCGGEFSDNEEGDDRPRQTVETLRTTTGSVSAWLQTTGVVESEAEANIVPEAAGIVIAIHAEEGDSVRRGEVLATIANANLDAGLSRAASEVARAERELSRGEVLAGQGALSDRELQELRYAAQTAATTLAEAEATEGHTRLRSPIAGTVSIRDIREGELAGGTRAFQVLDLSRLRVVLELPERDLHSLAVDQRVEIVSLYDDEAMVMGRVERVSPTVDPTRGTVRVTVGLPEQQTTLKPGQFVSARIEVGHHEDVVIVPRRAVRLDEGVAAVFLVGEEVVPEPDEDQEVDEEEPEEVVEGEEHPDDEPPEPSMQAFRTPITLAEQYVTVLRSDFGQVLEWIEVVEGLDVDTPVISRGMELIQDGALVVVAEPLGVVVASEQTTEEVATDE